VASSQRAGQNRSRATIEDVAKLAGVSTATVSRVINRTALVAPETEAQVLSAIADLNYRPRTAAQVLASQKTKTIGLLLTEISGDFISPLLRGIESEVRENGFGLLIYATQPNGNADPIPLPLGEHSTDGVLSFVDSVPDTELVRFSQIGFPVVLIHRSSPNGLEIPCVSIENKHGARQLVDHLIEVHGYRRIGFLTGQEGHEDSHWRELGYRESLAAHGIPFDPELIAEGGFSRLQAQSAIENWLLEGIEFDAVFTGDDEAAIGVLTALNRAGKKVPEDVAVVGFDDTYLSRFLTPPLTTVRVPIEQVGREAVKQLMKQIQGQAGDPLSLLPVEMVIRRSCGCPDPGPEDGNL
jgi:DNA-binding LacI/PurR family transcriptional regulator